MQIRRFFKLKYSHNAPIEKRNEALPYKHFVSFFIFPTFRATCFLSEKIEFQYNMRGLITRSHAYFLQRLVAFCEYRSQRQPRSL